MANTNDARSHNQPSHEAQVKGGEHSHQSTTHKAENAQHQQGEDGRKHNTPPTHEEQVKGGQHSHSGSQQK